MEDGLTVLNTLMSIFMILLTMNGLTLNYPTMSLDGIIAVFVYQLSLISPNGNTLFLVEALVISKKEEIELLLKLLMTHISLISLISKTWPGIKLNLRMKKSDLKLEKMLLCSMTPDIKDLLYSEDGLITG